VAVNFPDAPVLNEMFAAAGREYVFNRPVWLFGPGGAMALDSLVPDNGLQGVATAVKLIGENFRSNSQVLVDGVSVPFAYVSPSELRVSITGVQGGPGSATVQVVGDTASDILTYDFIIVTVTSVAPITATMNEPIVVTVRGTDFSAGTQIIIAGAAVPTTFVSATELTANYTPPYHVPATQPPPAVPCSVNVTNAQTPDFSISLTDPRFTIRSCYPDYWSEWVPVNQIEVWGWGLISDQSVCYLDGDAKITRMQFNINDSEYILIFDMENWPANDGYYPLQVLNTGGHWSQGSFDYYVERIGLSDPAVPEPAPTSQKPANVRRPAVQRRR
jgi:hypothetical protein